MINQSSNSQRNRQNDVYFLEKDSYLLCFHVKSSTIFCGVIIFIMSFMNIVILLSKFTIDFNADKDTNTPHLDPRFKTNKLIILYIIAESLKLLISSLLIYGVTRCKPSYLIPFFLMQLFYFFRSVSFFLEHYANYQANFQQNANNVNIYQSGFYDNVQKSNRNTQEIPQSYPMLVFFFSLLYKLYFITSVFKCYKYLKIKEAAFQINQNFQFRQNHQPVNATINVLHQTSPPSYNEVAIVFGTTKDGTDYNDQKLPSYEEACKIALPEQVKNETNANDAVANSSAININEANAKSTSNAQV